MGVGDSLACMTRGLDLFSLAGRGALVTGGNRGLGLSFVRTLADCGAQVAFAARDAGRER